MEYEVTFEVRIGGRLSDHGMERLREAMLKALDEANLPYKADVVTGSVRPL